MRIENPTLGYT